MPPSRGRGHIGPLTEQVRRHKDTPPAPEVRIDPRLVLVGWAIVVARALAIILVVLVLGQLRGSPYETWSGVPPARLSVCPCRRAAASGIHGTAVSRNRPPRVEGIHVMSEA